MEHGINTMTRMTTTINVIENGTFLEQYLNISLPLKPQHQDISGNNSYYTIVLVGLGLAIYCVLYIRRRRNKKRNEEKREQEYLSYYHSILPQSRIYGGPPPSDTNIPNMAKVIHNQKASEISVSYGLANVAGLILMEQFPNDTVDQDNLTENNVDASNKVENTKIAELVKQLQNESKECAIEHMTEFESIFTEEQLTKIVELILLEQLNDEGTEMQEDKVESCVNTDQETKGDELIENNANTNETEIHDFYNHKQNPALKIENELLTNISKTGIKQQDNNEIVNEQSTDRCQIVIEPQDQNEIAHKPPTDLHEVVPEPQGSSEIIHKVFTISNKFRNLDKTQSHDHKPIATNYSEANSLPSYDCDANTEMPTDTNAILIQKWDRKFRSHLQKHKPTAVVFHDDYLTATWI